MSRCQPGCRRHRTGHRSSGKRRTRAAGRDAGRIDPVVDRHAHGIAGGHREHHGGGRHRQRAEGDPRLQHPDRGNRHGPPGAAGSPGAAVARKQLEEGTKQAARHHHRFPWCTGSVENRKTARSIVSGTIRMSVLPVILPAVQLGGKFRAFLVAPLPWRYLGVSEVSARSWKPLECSAGLTSAGLRKGVVSRRRYNGDPVAVDIRGPAFFGIGL